MFMAADKQQGAKKKRLHWWRLCKNKRVTGRDDDDATFGH